MDNEKSIQPVNLQIVHTDYEEDEISLYDIWLILVKYKNHVASITLICTLSALIYVLVAPPTYQAISYLLLPNGRDIADLNVSGDSYSIEQVHEHFMRTFNSLSVRRLFFEKNNIISELIDMDDSDVDIDEVFIKKFSNKLTIESSSPVAMTASMSTVKARLAADWLNNFVNFANEMAVNSLKQDIVKNLNLKKADFILKISNLRLTASKKKKDSVVILTEAVETAQKLGLKQAYPSTVSRSNMSPEPDFDTSKESDIFSVKDQSTNLMFNLQQEPLYSRGADALSAELEAISSRKDDDPFIAGLREFEEQVIILDSAINRIESSKNIKSIIVDQKAIVPKLRVKPKRLPILILGFSVGLILSIFIVFILIVAGKIKEQAK